MVALFRNFIKKRTSQASEIRRAFSNISIRSRGLSLRPNFLFPVSTLLHHHQERAVATGFALISPMAKKGLTVLKSAQAAHIDMVFL